MPNVVTQEEDLRHPEDGLLRVASIGISKSLVQSNVFMESREYKKMYELEDTHWWFSGKRSLVEIFLKGFGYNRADTKILDVGCGTGGMFGILTKWGEVYTLDSNNLALYYCRLRGITRTVQAALPRLPFRDKSFDIVTVFDVLYHRTVKDDLEALKECFRVCKSGGRIIVTDAAFNFLRRARHDGPLHTCRRYTCRRLKERVEKSGFVVEKTSYTNSILFYPVILKKVFEMMGKINIKPTGSDLRKTNIFLSKLLSFILKCEAIYLSRMSLPLGTSVICIGRK